MKTKEELGLWFEKIRAELQSLKSCVLDQTPDAPTVPVYDLLPIDVNAEHKFDPDADGVSVRFTWRELQPVNEGFRWAYLDRLAERVREAGLPLMLRMMAGRHSPEWTSNDWVAVSDGDEQYHVPLPTPTHASRVVNAVRVVAHRYQPDVMHCAGWHKSAECTRIPGVADHLHDVAYYTRQAEEIAAEGVTPVFNVAPPGGKPWVAALLDYASDFDVVVQSNALGAQMNPELDWVQQIIDAKHSAWQAVCPVGNQDRFNPRGKVNGGVPFAAEVAMRADPLWIEWYSPKGGEIAELKRLLS